MKHPLTLEGLCRFLRGQQIDISDPQLKLLNAYHSLLLNWSQRQNLFARGDRRFLIERHFVPSFYFFYLLSGFIDKNFVDVGSGAGFPGIILKIMLPEISITLIDSSRKKCLFLQEVNDELNLGANIRHMRLENIKVDKMLCFDVAVARFLGDLTTLWRGIEPLLKPNGKLFVQKGGHQQIALPAKADHLRSWYAGSEWINISPTLSTKFIIEVKKYDE